MSDSWSYEWLMSACLPYIWITGHAKWIKDSVEELKGKLKYFSFATWFNAWHCLSLKSSSQGLILNTSMVRTIYQCLNMTTSKPINWISPDEIQLQTKTKMCCSLRDGILNLGKQIEENKIPPILKWFAFLAFPTISEIQHCLVLSAQKLQLKYS